MNTSIVHLSDLCGMDNTFDSVSNYGEHKAVIWVIKLKI